LPDFTLTKSELFPAKLVKIGKKRGQKCQKMAGEGGKKIAKNTNES